MKFAIATLALLCASCATTETATGSHVEHRPRHFVDKASDKPEVIAWSVPLEATQQLASLAGPVSSIRSFQFSCGAVSPALVVPSTAPKSYSAIWVWVNSATPVYFGDSAVSSTGMPLCTTTASCVQASQSFEARALYCLSSSGSVTVNVATAVP